jgi:hypothetical protein
VKARAYELFYGGPPLLESIVLRLGAPVRGAGCGGEAEHVGLPDCGVWYLHVNVRVELGCPPTYKSILISRKASHPVMRET